MGDLSMLDVKSCGLRLKLEPMVWHIQQRFENWGVRVGRTRRDNTFQTHHVHLSSFHLRPDRIVRIQGCLPRLVRNNLE